MIDLGLTAAQFWDTTPRMLTALHSRAQQREERADRRAQMLAVLYANAHRDPKKHPKPYTIETLFTKGTEAARPPQTPDDTVAFFEMMREAILHRDENMGQQTKFEITKE